MKRLKVFAILGLILALCGCGKSVEYQITEQLELGQKYLAEMDYEQAIVAFNKVIELDVKNVEAYLGLDQAYAASRDYKTAIQTLEQGYEVSRDDRLSWNQAIRYANTITAFLAEGQNDESGQYVEEGIEKFILPDSSIEKEYLDEFIESVKEFYDLAGDIGGFVTFYERLVEAGIDTSVLQDYLDEHLKDIVSYYSEKADACLDADDEEGALEYLHKAKEYGDNETVDIRIKAIENGGEYEIEDGKVYDTYGNLVRETTRNNGTIMNKYYDSSGNIVQTDSYSEKGEWLYSLIYHYDEKGRVIRSEGTELDPWNNSKERKFTYVYKYESENDSRPLGHENYDENGTYICYIEFIYDENGNRIGENRYDPDGALISD